MTIKRYLFILLTTFLVVMAASQIFLVDQLKQKMEQEIELRGKRLANLIIDRTIENIPQDAEVEVEVHELEFNKYTDKNKTAHKSKSKSKRSLNAFRIEIKDMSNGVRNDYDVVLPGKSRKSEELINQLLKNEPKSIRKKINSMLRKFYNGKEISTAEEFGNIQIFITKDERSTHQLFKKHLKQQIEHYKEIDPDLSEHKPALVKIIEKRHKSANKGQSFLLEKMINSITYIIIFTSILGIIFVFWLSNKISQPMNNLTLGFRKIEQGEKDVEVEVSGTNEIQFAITQFNAMSKQLVLLEQMETKLSERSHLEEIGDVSKGIAHALRNPLHTIGLAIDQLQKPDCDETTKLQLLDNIKVKISQLNKSIAALLTLTSGKMERGAKIDINSLIKDVTLELKQSHPSNTKPLEIEFELGEQSFVVGELNELRSILHTIIFNGYEAAISHNPDVLKLKINKYENDDQTCITVSDNGGGIDKNIEPQLFAPHVSSKAEGAGMGLYIGKRIAELYYNGSLNLKNTSEGAKATLILRKQG